MRDVILIKYGEIVLRGKNRKLIEDRLSKTIKKNIEKIDNFFIYKDQGRLVIESKNNKKIDFEKVMPLIVNIFGVTAVCPALKIQNREIDNIKENALLHMKQSFGTEKNYTFKVETKRADKKYSLNSKEISRDVGGYILENLKNLKVNVHNPDITLFIEIRTCIYITTKIFKCFGGLPIGNNGKATLLLSGGIDSPVAGFMMAKRGIEIEAVYFHSPPYTSDRAKQKVIDIAQKLSLYTGNIKLYIVNFTDIQLKIYNDVPPEKLTIVLKRYMLKIAQKIALSSGSIALITGDSIGQVASQTLHSIDAVSSCISNMEIFRPLCGLDKQEIINIARNIGTFDISIRPFEDCCTIFVPKFPETKPKKSIIESIDNGIENIEELVEKSIKTLEIIQF